MASERQRVIWSGAARDALNEAVAFIARDSPDGASKVLDAALDVTASLETLCERGRVVPEYGHPDVRDLFVYSYRLMYRIQPGTVTVLAFVHGARDFRQWLREHEWPQSGWRLGARDTKPGTWILSGLAAQVPGACWAAFF